MVKTIGYLMSVYTSINNEVESLNPVRCLNGSGFNYQGLIVITRWRYVLVVKISIADLFSIADF